LLRSGLNVDVVVNGDGREAVVVSEDAVNDGIAFFSALNLGFAAVALDRFDREIDAFSDVF
jgi:hypothetical protein